MDDWSKALISGLSICGCVGSKPSQVKVERSCIKLPLGCNELLLFNRSANTLESQNTILTFKNRNDNRMRARCNETKAKSKNTQIKKRKINRKFDLLLKTPISA